MKQQHGRPRVSAGVLQRIVEGTGVLIERGKKDPANGLSNS